MHTLWEHCHKDCWQDLQCVYEEKGKGMTDMNFNEFLFICGFCIVSGIAIVFGGLLGFSIFVYFKKVMQDE